MNKEGAVLAARILTELRPEKIEPLVDKVQEVIRKSEKELSGFSEFLQSDD